MRDTRKESKHLPSVYPWWLSLLINVLWIADLQAVDFDTFKQEAEKAGAVYIAYSDGEEFHQLFVEGKASEAIHRLQSLTPDDAKSVYDYFILGNMLYQLDPNVSYSYMIRAERLEPDNPMILYERGMHEHRNSQFQSALRYYERLVRARPEGLNPIAWAYITHAYLMQGDVDKAFNAWRKSDFSEHHIAIEKGMYTLFSDSHQEARREAFVRDIEAGAADKLCDLWALDSNWEIDWWNQRPKEDYLAFDRALIARTVTDANSPQAAQLRLCQDIDRLSQGELLQRLQALKISPPDNQLPVSATLIRKIFAQLTTLKAATPSQLFDRYGAQLKSYAAQFPQEPLYYDLLGFLYANAGKSDALKEVDEYGWKILKKEKFANSYVVGLGRENKAFIPTLNEALREFPNSTFLNTIYLQFGEKNKQTLARYVASQFSNVSGSTYRLSDYMASLQYEIENL
ncbi:hypothetical protein [Hahella sp. HN01]|uniref:hypothetical protein n=1 Tax=Hahella sp. HN01 TaxID=2847262 RepID=UPI001C1F12A6|nr:hypothetical protein [Hahella sp. HN01]MBU6955793.1 hypothetical protein [Hahella sp. HN01]